MNKLMKTTMVAMMAAGTLMAAPATKGIYIGAGTMDVGTESETVYSIGWDVTKVTNQNILLGVNMEFEYADFSGAEVWGMAAEGKLGMKVLPQLSVYGIAGAKQQSTDAWDAYGFGFGGGITYDISQTFAVDMKYVDYTMNVDPVGEYDAPKASVNLRVNF